MNGWDVLGFAISAIISALVAILVTGKITSSLADRAFARRLRLRARRVLRTGPGREQLGWWYAATEDLEEMASRLVSLGDEATSVSAVAARDFGHAAEMIQVFLRCRMHFDKDIELVNRSLQNQVFDLEAAHALEELHRMRGTSPSRDELEERERIIRKAQHSIQASIETRDTALSSVAEIYRNLLEADYHLARVGRWLRIMDWRAQPEPPAHYRTALRYAKDHLNGAIVGHESKEEPLEAHRVASIAIQIPPGTGLEEIDAALTRRNITHNEMPAIENPRYGGVDNSNDAT